MEIKEIRKGLERLLYYMGVIDGADAVPPAIKELRKIESGEYVLKEKCEKAVKEKEFFQGLTDCLIRDE